MTIYLLRILAIGQLVNLLVSAPGNSIIPNLGVPKYLMYEGIISLAVNLVLSFVLIKYYGIVGAAIGTTAATLIASTYIYITSAGYFKENPFKFMYRSYFKPLLIALTLCIIVYTIYYFALPVISLPTGRLSGIIPIVFTSGLFFTSYIFILWKSGYLNERDKDNMNKLIKLINPMRKKG